ncbi:MAG: HD domain-containing protein [Aureliella sp.]
MAVDLTGLIPISRRTIAADIPSPADIYLLAAGDQVPEVFCTAGASPSEARMGELASRTDVTLYVRPHQRQEYQQHLDENWHDLVFAPGGRPCEKVAVVGEIVREVLRDAFRGGNTDQIVEEARKLAEKICYVLDGQAVLASELFDLLHHDYAVFTHSTNVALYSVTLARELGFSAADQQEIALGGLLHDIGKLELDENLLNKTGQLTRLQYREIMLHPVHGFCRLVDRAEISFGQLMMVYQHHERADGSGYPSSIVAEEIHPWASICAIADAYEALTAERPYRAGLPPEKAIATLTEMKGKLDCEMLSCWEKLICQTV